MPGRAPHRLLVALLGVGLVAGIAWLVLRDDGAGRAGDGAHRLGADSDSSLQEEPHLAGRGIEGGGGGAPAEGGGGPDSPGGHPATTGAHGADTPGRLRLRARWTPSGEPLAQVVVDVLKNSPYALTVFRLDADGRGVWDPAPPGSWTLRTELGGFHDVRVEPGATTDVEWEVEEGLLIRGVVVDGTGRPVGDAEVWLGPLGRSTEGSVVTRAAEDGTFRLRVEETSVSLGAHAVGRAPSMRQFVEGVSGSTVDVRLVLPGPGGALELVVLDADGVPLPGARALVGTGEVLSEETEAGPLANLPTARYAETDAEGRARLDGLPPGDTPVFVRASGHALEHSTVTIPAVGVARSQVRLQREPIVRGRVTDVLGQAVARAGVSQTQDGFDMSPWFLLLKAWSADDGTYELHGLPIGTVRLEARDQDHGSARVTLSLAPGAETPWDPVLGTGPAIIGRLLDAEGRPLPTWRVVAEAPAWRVERSLPRAFGETDAEGRFELPSLPDVPYRLAAHAPTSPWGVPPQARWEGIRADGVERVFRVPPQPESAYVQGVFLDAAGRPLREATVWVVTPDARRDSWNTRLDPSTGAFRFGPCPPGTWLLRVTSEGLPNWVLGEIMLLAGEERDLGEVRLPPTGSLEVRVQAQGGAELGSVEIDVEQDGRWVDGAEVEDGRMRVRRLYGGTYLVRAWGDVLDEPGATCTIRAGEETTLDLRVTPGVRQSFDCTMAVAERLPTTLAIRLEDESGTLVDEDTEDFTTGPEPIRRLESELETGRRTVHSFSYGLRPGRYRVRVTTDTGLAGELPFDARWGEPPADLELRLERPR